MDGRTSDYTYNDRYWLTSEIITDAVNGNYSASYSYDKVGNRLLGKEGGITTQYQYDDNDRLIQQGGVTYGYDDNGNTVLENDQGLITSYGYNSQNQLASHSKNGVTTNYRYDAAGIRHGQANAIDDTEYFVDSNRRYAQVLVETINGSLDVAYHYGDDLVSQERSADTHYFHVDGLGSTRVLSDSVGNTSNYYAYAAFGKLLNQPGETQIEYLFAGEQYDENLGQYYVLARYYSQSVGRFSRMDSWKGNEFNPTTLNKYMYADASPSNNIDPTGMFSLSSFGTAQNIQTTLRTRSGVSGFRSAVNQAVGASLKQSGKALKQATKILRQCIKKKDKCDLEFNLLIVGSDNDAMRDHIQWAQSRQMWRTIVLKYEKDEIRRSRAGW